MAISHKANTRSESGQALPGASWILQHILVHHNPLAHVFHLLSALRLYTWQSGRWLHPCERMVISRKLREAQHTRPPVHRTLRPLRPPLEAKSVKSKSPCFSCQQGVTPCISCLQPGICNTSVKRTWVLCCTRDTRDLETFGGQIKTRINPLRIQWKSQARPMQAFIRNSAKHKPDFALIMMGCCMLVLLGS